MSLNTYICYINYIYVEKHNYGYRDTWYDSHVGTHIIIGKKNDINKKNFTININT